jgi:hypothetical protein
MPVHGTASATAAPEEAGVPARGHRAGRQVRVLGRVGDGDLAGASSTCAAAAAPSRISAPVTGPGWANRYWCSTLSPARRRDQPDVCQQARCLPAGSQERCSQPRSRLSAAGSWRCRRLPVCGLPTVWCGGLVCLVCLMCSLTVGCGREPPGGLGCVPVRQAPPGGGRHSPARMLPRARCVRGARRQRRVAGCGYGIGRAEAAGVGDGIGWTEAAGLRDGIGWPEGAGLRDGIGRAEAVGLGDGIGRQRRGVSAGTHDVLLAHGCEGSGWPVWGSAGFRARGVPGCVSR